MIGFFVKEGHLNKLDLAGVKIVFAASWPKAIHQGNGIGALFIDSAASPAQVSALASILSGQIGGMPFEALAGTFTEFEGPIIKSIVMDTSNKHASFSIEGILEVAQTPLLNPMNGEDQNVHITYPDGGFFWNDGIIGTTKAMTIDHNTLVFQHVGKFAAKANVSWAN